MKQMLIIIMALCLVSCATMPAKPGALNKNTGWPARQAQLAKVNSWQINGAVAIRTAKAGQTASINWQQQERVYQISLFGPLGAGRVSLNGTPQSVELLANGKRYEARTPEALMQQVLGWQLPVENLYYWVRGLPAPKLAAKLQFDAYHHLTQLTQQGWQIDFLRYTAVGSEDLPSLLLLSNHDLHVKLVVSEWKI